jgi:hypothetical protein
MVEAPRFFVMPGLKREELLRADVPGIHAFLAQEFNSEDVDGRDEARP